jgi:hypothetical protein
VQIDGANLEWQAEAAYARGNVAVVCLETSRVAEALDALAREREIWERIRKAQPDRAFDLANTIGWIARAREAQNDFEQAIDAQKEKMRVLEAVPNAAGDERVRRSLFTVNHELARLELALGRQGAALQFAQTAVQSAQALVDRDAQNKVWLEQLSFAQANLAEAEFANGNRAGAREYSRLALGGSAQLVALDPKMAKWQVNLRGSALQVAALLADDGERRALVDALNDYLAKVRQFAAVDRGLTQTGDVIVAQAELQLGVLLEDGGQPEEAKAHWRAVVARVQAYAEGGDLPALTVLATAQFRLGALSDARSLARRIESTPYRHPAYAELKQMLAGGSGLSVAKR